MLAIAKTLGGSAQWGIFITFTWLFLYVFRVNVMLSAILKIETSIYLARRNRVVNAGDMEKFPKKTTVAKMYEIRNKRTMRRKVSNANQWRLLRKYICSYEFYVVFVCICRFFAM